MWGQERREERSRKGRSEEERVERRPKGLLEPHVKEAYLGKIPV